MKKQLFIVVISLITLLSCTKKEGCTNVLADNYDLEATKENNSCSYTANLIFWFNEQTAEQLILDGCDDLEFKINGFSERFFSTGYYWLNSPNCGDLDNIEISKNIRSPTETISYTIQDQNTKFVYWSGEIELNTEKCTVLQLEW